MSAQCGLELARVALWKCDGLPAPFRAGAHMKNMSKGYSDPTSVKIFQVYVGYVNEYVCGRRRRLFRYIHAETMRLMYQSECQNVPLTRTSLPNMCCLMD